MRPRDYIIPAIRKDGNLGAAYDRLSKERKEAADVRIDKAVEDYCSDNLPGIWELIKIKVERLMDSFIARVHP